MDERNVGLTNALAEYVLHWLGLGYYLTLDTPSTRPGSDTTVWELLPHAPECLRELLLTWFEETKAYMPCAMWVIVRKGLAHNKEPIHHRELVRAVCDVLNKGDGEVARVLACSFKEQRRA